MFEWLTTGFPDRLCNTKIDETVAKCKIVNGKIWTRSSSKWLLAIIDNIDVLYGLLPEGMDGDVDLAVAGLAHIEQLISNVCLSCEDVVSLLDADAWISGLGFTAGFWPVVEMAAFFGLTPGLEVVLFSVFFTIFGFVSVLVIGLDCWRSLSFSSDEICSFFKLKEMRWNNY